LVVLSVFVLGGTAGADLFFTTADSGYSANSAGIVKGSTYEVFHSLNSNLPAGFANDSVALTFRDATTAERILISERRSTGDTVYIYDLRNWERPVNPTGWNATNIYDAVSIGQYLYVVTNGWDNQSGQIIKVNMNNGYISEASYTFTRSTGNNLALHPIRIFTDGTDLYVISNAYDDGWAGPFDESEVLKFDTNLSPVGAPVLVGINAGGMGSSAALYGSDLYVACLGNFNDGSFWKVDLSSMDATKLIDLSSHQAYGIAIAADGTALLLTASWWEAEDLYRTHVGDIDNYDKWFKVSDFGPKDGWSFGAIYDEHNGIFWLMNGTHLEARNRTTGGLLRSFTPAQLADDQIYSLAVIGNNSWRADGGDGGSGDGGCDTGAGSRLFALVMLVIVRAGLLKTRKK